MGIAMIAASLRKRLSRESGTLGLSGNALSGEGALDTLKRCGSTLQSAARRIVREEGSPWQPAASPDPTVGEIGIPGEYPHGLPYMEHPLDSPSRMDSAQAVGEVTLTLSNLTKAFAGVGPVVERFDLEVMQGELLSVLGPSGCGKTTLLRLIGGFEVPDGGEVRHQGHVISRPGWVLPPEDRRFGFVFQEYSLFPHLTVRENVQFGLTPSPVQRLKGWLGRTNLKDKPVAGTNGDGDHQARLSHKRGLMELLTICGLAEMTERYPHELSGGQQQRVALARALAVRPGLILLDEPFSSLDASLRARLREEVRGILKQLGTTAILVTHDQEEAVNMGDRVAVMSRGSLEQLGSPEAILRHPKNRFVASFVGRNGFLPGHIENRALITELGKFDPPEDMGSGAVDLLLRPNQFVLEQSPGGVPAEVREITYLGGQPLYTLALPSGQKIEALLPDSARPARGDRVHIAYRPSPLVCFPSL